MLTFCGFNKEHPHDPYSILRLGFKNSTDVGVVRQYLNDAIEQSISAFQEIKDAF